MNGNQAGSGPYGHEGSRLSPPAPTADGKAIFEAYRKDIITGFEKDAPRYNPMNPERTQSSAMVDLKDPIQVHLLTETALTDSKQYEILSQEEVDELKKQSQYLKQRIDSTRSNLIIQEKYRNAAISMAKLYSPGKGDGKRRSLLGNRHSGDQNAKDAEIERKACERKCEELAAELFSLEKRLMEPHQRLLEHTAGILQLTHNVSKRKNTTQNGQAVNGIPGSPESLYTYSQSRNSLDHENYLEDTSFYQLDGLEGTRQSKKNAIEIPQRSPIREQTNQLREEIDRVREENKALLQLVAETGQRLESLNGALRETIIRFSPDVNNDYDEPPRASGTSGPDTASFLRSQVDYLESGLVAVQAEQQSYSGGAETGSRIESVNLQVRDLLMSANHHFDPAPIPPESDVDGQLAYLEDAISMVDTELARAMSSKGQGAEDSEAALTGLWDTIQSGFADIKQRKEDRRRARAERGLEEDDEMSDDDGLDIAEAYSLSAFTTRVQWLYRQATTLKDQKSVLKRQIKQQRELNNKSDAEKDEELESKQTELEQSRELVDRAEKDAMDAQNMLSDALSDLEKAREAATSGATARAELDERSARIGFLESKLKDLDERDAKIIFLEGNLKELENQLVAAQSGSQDAGSRLAEVDATIASLNSKLDVATKAKEKAEVKATDLQSELEKQEDEMEQLNMTLAETKTELTIAQAELDGAYGTRAERAADAAAIKNSAEVVRLGNVVEKLKKELAGTVKDLEDITKESIGSEREKSDLEGKLDDALSAKTALEGEIGGMNEKFEVEVQKLRDMIAKLHEELDGERLKAVPGGSKASAGATMLSEQFRATMRGERKKFQEDLREERTKSRRLEDELNRLKRAAGPGKSPLSPR